MPPKKQRQKKLRQKLRPRRHRIKKNLRPRLQKLLWKKKKLKRKESRLKPI